MLSLDLLVESPWPWLAISLLSVAAGLVAASGWPNRRPR